MPAARGEDHYQAKRSNLTNEKIREIRAKRENGCPACGGKLTYKQLADQYGVSPVMIFFIVKRTKWASVN